MGWKNKLFEKKFVDGGNLVIAFTAIQSIPEKSTPVKQGSSGKSKEIDIEGKASKSSKVYDSNNSASETTFNTAVSDAETVKNSTPTKNNFEKATGVDIIVNAKLAT